MTCASSKAMRYWSEMGPTTPTASRQKAWRLLSCSSSFTNGCAGPSPTAASITNPLLDIDQAVASRPPTIVPMQQFRKSSICSPPLDTAASSVGLVSRRLQRDGSHYAYRLTTKGVEVALLFLFFHKRLCGPLANSRFHHQPDARHRPGSRLEAAYHRADAAIQKVVDLLAAA